MSIEATNVSRLPRWIWTEVLTFAVFVVLVVCFSVRAVAQISLTATNFPSKVGEFRRAYVDISGVSVAKLIGPPGGSHVWDFAYPPTANESVHRIEIVPPNAGTCTQHPAGTAYAEQTTRESSEKQSWEYYSIAPGVGRYYYGFCDQVGNPSGPGVVFDDRTLDFPECTLGTKWERTVTFEDVIDPGLGIGLIPVSNVYTSTASVDAFGTLRLPGIGAVPALRVTETNSTTSTALILGAPIPLGTQYTHNYSFLAPGIGRAVQIISKPSTSGPPAVLDATGTILRVFESSSIPPLCTLNPVLNLLAELKGRQLFLSWSNAGPNARYVVAVTDDLNLDPAPMGTPLSSLSIAPSAPVRLGCDTSLQSSWIPLVTNANNFLFIDIPSTPPQRFYRVDWF